MGRPDTDERDPDHEAENPMCACPTCINEGWAQQATDADRQEQNDGEA